MHETSSVGKCDSFFSNFNLKIPKNDIFGPKFKDLYFSIKLFIFTKSRVLIPNIANFFQKNNPKLPKKDIFGPKLEIYFFLDETSYFVKIEVGDIIYDYSFFSNLTLKITHKSIFGPKLKIFIFA